MQFQIILDHEQIIEYPTKELSSHTTIELRIHIGSLPSHFTQSNTFHVQTL